MADLAWHRARRLLDGRRLPDLGAVRQALRARARRLQPSRRGFRGCAGHSRLGPRVQRIAEGAVLMARASSCAWRRSNRQSLDRSRRPCAAGSGERRRASSRLCRGDRRRWRSRSTSPWSLVEAAEPSTISRPSSPPRRPTDGAGDRRDRRAVPGRDRHAVAVAAQPACPADRGAARGRRQGDRPRHHLCRAVDRPGQRCRPRRSARAGCRAGRRRDADRDAAGRPDDAHRAAAGIHRSAAREPGIASIVLERRRHAAARAALSRRLCRRAGRGRRRAAPACCRRTRCCSRSGRRAPIRPSPTTRRSIPTNFLPHGFLQGPRRDRRA